ncbi:MAG: acetolactate synthase [Clostridia bacterium]|nr:acetolactate synthase [Clostridia bacterium]MBR0357063.1 acetolactate synthase [Clostridia bacterium]
MSIKQLSVFLENRPGKLFELTKLLAERRIDMRALSIAETTDFGIARIIVDDADKAARVLQEEQFIAQFSDVLAFAVPDEPGGLHNLLGEFNAAQVNIEYMYAFLGGEPGRAYMIFRVTDTAASEKKLTERGLRSLSLSEIKL